jgi:hypothetical protein
MVKRYERSSGRMAVVLGEVDKGEDIQSAQSDSYTGVIL